MDQQDSLATYRGGEKQAQNQSSTMDMTYQKGVNQTNLSANPLDLTVLINNETSRKSRQVINRLNEEMRSRGMNVGREGSGFLTQNVSQTQRAGDTTRLGEDGSGRGGIRTSRSSTLLKNGQNVLGMSQDATQAHNVSSMTMGSARTGELHPNASMMNLRARPASGQDSLSAAESLQNWKRKQSATTSRALDPNLPNPNARLNAFKLGGEDRKEVSSAWKAQEDKEKAEKVSKYINDLNTRIEEMGQATKNFKLYDQVQMDAQDEEIRKWTITQKKVDEERRAEVETRLRAIFNDKRQASGYSPSEGFTLSVDFL